MGSHGEVLKLLSPLYFWNLRDRQQERKRFTNPQGLMLSERAKGAKQTLVFTEKILEQGEVSTAAESGNHPHRRRSHRCRR